jgi:hypothetical protein
VGCRVSSLLMKYLGLLLRRYNANRAPIFFLTSFGGRGVVEILTYTRFEVGDGSRIRF